MGMEFYGIFIPVPENWIGIFHLDSRSRKMGMEFAISRSRSRSPKVIPAHGCPPYNAEEEGRWITNPGIGQNYA